MLLYPFSALVTSFARTFIIKDNANNGRNPPSYHFPAFVTRFLDIAFINEEAKGCINEEAICAINEAAISAIMVTRNPPSSFFTSCATVSVAPSNNRPESFFYSIWVFFHENSRFRGQQGT